MQPRFNLLDRLQRREATGMSMSRVGSFEENLARRLCKHFTLVDNSESAHIIESLRQLALRGVAPALEFFFKINTSLLQNLFNGAVRPPFDPEVHQVFTVLRDATNSTYNNNAIDASYILAQLYYEEWREAYNMRSGFAMRNVNNGLSRHYSHFLTHQKQFLEPNLLTKTTRAYAQLGCIGAINNMIEVSDGEEHVMWQDALHNLETTLKANFDQYFYVCLRNIIKSGQLLIRRANSNSGNGELLGSLICLNLRVQGIAVSVQAASDFLHQYFVENTDDIDVAYFISCSYNSHSVIRNCLTDVDIQRACNQVIASAASTSHMKAKAARSLYIRSGAGMSEDIVESARLLKQAFEFGCATTACELAWEAWRKDDKEKALGLFNHALDKGKRDKFFIAYLLGMDQHYGSCLLGLQALNNPAMLVIAIKLIIGAYYIGEVHYTTEIANHLRKLQEPGLAARWDNIRYMAEVDGNPASEEVTQHLSGLTVEVLQNKLTALFNYIPPRIP